MELLLDPLDFLGELLKTLFLSCTLLLSKNALILLLFLTTIILMPVIRFLPLIRNPIFLPKVDFLSENRLHFYFAF